MATALRFEIPEWHGDAACRDMPDFFDGPVVAAKKVCNGCPVVEECLADAMEHPWLQGVWGGTSERQRLAMRRRRAAAAA